MADLGGVAFINLMYVLFLPLSFLIPSSSGLATVAMPIMAPLAGFADVPPQLVVTAYQTANGLLNLVTPTSAVVMGGLAIARVGYGTWLRFVWPVLVLLGILTVVVLTVGVLLRMTLACTTGGGTGPAMTAQAPAGSAPPGTRYPSERRAQRAGRRDPAQGLSAAEVEKRRRAVRAEQVRRGQEGAGLAGVPPPVQGPDADRAARRGASSAWSSSASRAARHWCCSA